MRVSAASAPTTDAPVSALRQCDPGFALWQHQPFTPFPRFAGTQLQPGSGDVSPGAPEQPEIPMPLSLDAHTRQANAAWSPLSLVKQAVSNAGSDVGAGPHTSVDPQLSTKLPHVQCSVSHVFCGAQPHWLLAPQMPPSPQVPQLSIAPHPLGPVPQFQPRPAQVFGVQPHRFVSPPPPQLSGAVHMQVIVPPQPSESTPHLAPQVAGVHVWSPH
jgi:hypothetical protein